MNKFTIYSNQHKDFQRFLPLMRMRGRSSLSRGSLRSVRAQLMKCSICSGEVSQIDIMLKLISIITVQDLIPSSESWSNRSLIISSERFASTNYQLLFFLGSKNKHQMLIILNYWKRFSTKKNKTVSQEQSSPNHCSISSI